MKLETGQQVELSYPNIMQVRLKQWLSSFERYLTWKMVKIDSFALFWQYLCQNGHFVS